MPVVAASKVKLIIKSVNISVRFLRNNNQCIKSQSLEHLKLIWFVQSGEEMENKSSDSVTGNGAERWQHRLGVGDWKWGGIEFDNGDMEKRKGASPCYSISGAPSPPKVISHLSVAPAHSLR